MANLQGGQQAMLIIALIAVLAFSHFFSWMHSEDKGNGIFQNAKVRLALFAVFLAALVYVAVSGAGGGNPFRAISNGLRWLF